MNEQQVRLVVEQFFNDYLNRNTRTFDLLTTGEARIPQYTDLNSMLAAYYAPAQWLRIARYGAGLSDDSPEEINAICMAMIDMLFLVPGLLVPEVPASWYDTPMGALWAKAHIKSLGDELITLAEASRISGLSIQAICSRINGGRLTAYTDPCANSRQGRRRVRRSAFQPQENHE